LMLAASRGTSIDVHTKGNQAKDLSEAIGVLIAARFGEDF
jgi:phosphocarrier protein HPr